jgi:hypothetical protein
MKNIRTMKSPSPQELSANSLDLDAWGFKAAAFREKEKPAC